MAFGMMLRCDVTFEECRTPEMCHAYCRRAAASLLETICRPSTDLLAIAIRLEFHNSRAAMVCFTMWLADRCAGLTECARNEGAWRHLRGIRERMASY